MVYSEKPWLKNYKLGPYRLKESLKPYPKEPVYKALDNAAENYPGQTAILFDGREIKYRQLKILVEKLASGLASLGVEKGECKQNRNVYSRKKAFHVFYSLFNNFRLFLVELVDIVVINGNKKKYAGKRLGCY